MTTDSSRRTQLRSARLAGALYLATMATGVFGTAFVRSALIVPGDATATAQKIAHSDRLFRLGIVSDLATSTGVLVLIWALYVLLRPVNKELALLAAFFRLVGNAVSFVANLGSLVALLFLSQAGYLEAFDESQLHSLARLSISVLGAGYNLDFVLLGLGSAVFAYLLWESRYVPRVLAGWGVFASLLLATCCVLRIVLPGAAGTLQAVSFGPMGLYEVVLGAWLLLKGAKLAPTAAA